MTETEQPEVVAPDPDDFKPDSTDLEVREPDDIYRAMDRADEELILDEIQGRALEVYVYDFTHKGKRYTDLSVVGVNEAVRLLNERGGTAIRISPQAPIVEEISEGDESYVRVMVYAEDNRRGSSAGAWGTATEPKHMRPTSGRNAGQVIWDKFAVTKALNKAERNAKKKFVPEEIRQTIIAMARKDNKVKVLEAARSAVAELPPPLTDEKATELKTKLRAAYDELKGLNRMLLPPGQYNAMLTRSEHEHARLEELLAHIEGLVEREKNTVESSATEE